MSNHAVKKEMPSSVIVSCSNAAKKQSHQMLSLSEHANNSMLPDACSAVTVAAAGNQNVHAGCHLPLLACTQSQQQSLSGYASFSQVAVPEFCSPSNFMPSGQQFGHASAANQMRFVADGLDGACPPVSGDVFVSVSDHFMAN